MPILMHDSGSVLMHLPGDTLAGNEPPVLVNPIPDQTPTNGEAFTYVVPTDTFSDLDTFILSATLTGGVPLSTVGLSFNGVNFAGTLADDVSVAIVVTATDSIGQTATDTFVVSMQPIVPTAPTINSIDVSSIGVNSLTVLADAEDNSGAYVLSIIAVPNGFPEASQAQIEAGLDQASNPAPSSAVAAPNGSAGTIITSLIGNTTYDIQYVVADSEGTGVVGTLNNGGLGYTTLPIAPSGGGSAGRKRRLRRTA